MAFSVRPRAAAIVFSLSFPAIALSGEYRDPSGFTLTFPEGWVAVTRDSLGDVTQELPPDVRNWIAKNNVDLNRMSVVVIRQGNDAFHENVNVVVQDKQIPVEQSSVAKLTTVLQEQFTALGASVSNMTGRVQTFGSRDAVVMEHDIRFPGEQLTLRQRQALFPGGGRTFIVTCSSPVDRFDQYAHVFDEMLNRIQIPPPTSSGFDWSRVSNSAIMGGVIGGVVGGLAVIIRRVAKKAKQETT